MERDATLGAWFRESVDVEIRTLLELAKANDDDISERINTEPRVVGWDDVTQAISRSMALRYHAAEAHLFVYGKPIDWEDEKWMRALPRGDNAR